LVSAAAAFEAFWREFIRVNVDRHRAPPATLEHLKRASFTLADVQNILGRKLTLGELVASTYPLQGTEAVNAAFSEILQIKVFSELSSGQFAIREISRKNRARRRPLASATVKGSDILRTLNPKVDRCFEVRHDAVHSTGTLHRVSQRDAVLLENAVWQFTAYLGLFLENRFDNLWRQRRVRRRLQPNKRLERTGAQPARHGRTPVRAGRSTVSR
jgi:hypothetical protein